MEHEITEGNQPEKKTVIQTTIGDLIHAIAEAASEATISEAECYVLTQAVLDGLLNRRKD